jgi:hypothetical protein
MRQIITILLVCVAGLEAVDFQCEFTSFDNSFVKGIGCSLSNVNITSRQTITSVNGQSDFDGSSYKIIGFMEQVLHFIPKGLGKFFPNLEMLSIYKSKLKAVEKEDLKQFSNLSAVLFYLNEIQFLPSDLFEANPNISKIEISGNNISYVGHNLVTPLKNLELAYFNGNGCIDKGYNQTNIASLAGDLKAACSEPTQEMIANSQ